MKINYSLMFTFFCCILALASSVDSIKFRRKIGEQTKQAKHNILKLEQCGVPKSMAEKLAASYNIIDSNGNLCVGDIEASGELELIRGYKEISQ